MLEAHSLISKTTAELIFAVVHQSRLCWLDCNKQMKFKWTLCQLKQRLTNRCHALKFVIIQTKIAETLISWPLPVVEGPRPIVYLWDLWGPLKTFSWSKISLLWVCWNIQLDHRASIIQCLTSSQNVWGKIRLLQPVDMSHRNHSRHSEISVNLPQPQVLKLWLTNQRWLQ